MKKAPICAVIPYEGSPLMEFSSLAEASDYLYNCKKRPSVDSVSNVYPIFVSHYRNHPVEPDDRMAMTLINMLYDLAYQETESFDKPVRGSRNAENSIGADLSYLFGAIACNKKISASSAGSLMNLLYDRSCSVRESILSYVERFISD